MNYEMETHISLSPSEVDIEMVSYIYTKTSSRVWIETPQNILLKIKEMYSLSSNIYNQHFFGTTALVWESYHGSCFLSTKTNQNFDIFFMTNI